MNNNNKRANNKTDPQEPKLKIVKVRKVTNFLDEIMDDIEKWENQQ